jgi:hypothetical protein
MTGAGATRDPTPNAPPSPRTVKPVIRLKAPLDGRNRCRRLVQGRVTWSNENLDDLVLLRSDGTPTYMLAVVVDDHDMGVTHDHPRRRSPDQRRPPDADLSGDGLGGAAWRISR